MKRLLSWIAVALAVVGLGGILLVLLGALHAWRAVARVRWTPRPSWRVLVWARVWSLYYRVPWPLMIAILKNEAASSPTQAFPDRYPLGDVSDPRGPALGPGQVLRVNVDRLWREVRPPLRWIVVLSSPEALARVGSERAALWASARMAREALDEVGGDLHDAARRYNGFGPRAEAYADRADETRRLLA